MVRLTPSQWGAAIFAAFFLSLALYAAGQTMRIEGFALGPVKVEGYKKKLSDAEDHILVVEAERDAVSHARDDERTAAKTAYDDKAKQCAADIASARRAAQIIERITYVPEVQDPSGCPARGLVDADQLRQLFEASGPGGTASVPARPNGGAASGA